MAQEDLSNLTLLLQQWQSGDKAAERELIELVRIELRRMAEFNLKKQANQGLSMQTTELLHELYIRLSEQNRSTVWQDRHQFFAFSARILRQVLVDAFREKKAQKRGGGLPNLLFDPDLITHNRQSIPFLALNEALAGLERVDARKCKIVELRFFGGLTVEEVAQTLEISTPTVKRDWRTARLWLLDFLENREADQEAGQSH
jgi:RNA polymerase sigma factor (TIGR02999 family)